MNRLVFEVVNYTYSKRFKIIEMDERFRRGGKDGCCNISKKFVGKNFNINSCNIPEDQYYDYYLYLRGRYKNYDDEVSLFNSNINNLLPDLISWGEKWEGWEHENAKCECIQETIENGIRYTIRTIETERKGDAN